jgi:hypothetical protein
MMTILLPLLWLALMADCASPSGRFAVLRKQIYTEHYDTYPTSSSSSSTHPTSSSSSSTHSSTNRQARRSSTRIYNDDNIDDNDDVTIRDNATFQQQSDCKGRFAVEYQYERNLNRSAEHANILQRRPDADYTNNNNGRTAMPAVYSNAESVRHNNRRQQRTFIHHNNAPIFV